MRISQSKMSVLFFLILFAGITLQGAEGMWPLYDLNNLPADSLRAKGLELTFDQIYNPEGTGIAGAAVQVGGGSGSFVSKDGLIVTNHHVAVGAAQKQSTVDQNYLRDGFYAGTMAGEIPAIGYKAYVTLGFSDVTEKVLADVNDDMNDFDRFQTIDKAKKMIIREAEDKGDVICEVAGMFGGTRYVLYEYLRLRDIRIVYVPPFYIGNYGGDIDNWMWPRHVGDFSFLRAYVAPDGTPSEYSEENVPYQPKVFLPISGAGVKEGDFAMVIGFPGRTNRYASSFEIDYLEKMYYPRAIRTSEDRVALLEVASSADSSVAIRLASRMQGINNYLKNNYGMVEGFKKSGLADHKRKSETMLTEFLNENPELNKKYGHVLNELDSLYRETIKTSERDFYIRGMSWSCELYDVALTLHKWAVEREKDDTERDRGYQDRDSIKTWEWLDHMQINFVPEVDKASMKYYLNKLAKLPQDQKIDEIEKICENSPKGDVEKCIDTYIDNLYAKTILGDKEMRLGLFGMSRKQIEKH